MIEQVSEYDTEQSFLETLTGEFKGNNKTRIGTAFHKIVEQGESCLSITELNESFPYEEPVKKFHCYIDDCTVIFNEQEVDCALNYRKSIECLYSEIACKKVYQTKQGYLQVTGTIDVLNGNFIRDIKTRFRPFKVHDYTDSMQWKLYLDIGELNTFYYDIFEVKGYNSDTLNISGLSILRHEPIECVAYLNMQNDISYLLNEFVDYIKFRNIETKTKQ